MDRFLRRRLVLVLVLCSVYGMRDDDDDDRVDTGLSPSPALTGFQPSYLLVSSQDARIPTEDSEGWRR